MALIICPECGREVSSSAAVCPACAYPVATRTPATPPRAAGQPARHQWWKLAISLFGRVAVGAILAGIGGGEEESVAAVIGGVMIAVSAIPTWYRFRIDRLRQGPGAAELEDRIENRMAEFERRQQEQIDRLEQTQVGQMADLEERVDFAERLLTKQRDQIDPG
jgi:hypothetical protein